MTDESTESTSTEVATEPTVAEAAVSALQSQLAENLGRARKTLFWTGLGFAVLGIIALVFPAVSSLLTTATIGWLLIFAGVFGFFGSFSFQGAGPFFGALLTSLLTVAVGVFMLRNPEMALKVLTIFVAVTFLVDGAFTTGAAFDLKPIKGWGWLLFSAAMSILAGILILAGFPETSVVILGILVGVRLLSGGISSIMLSKTIPKPES